MRGFAILTVIVGAVLAAWFHWGTPEADVEAALLLHELAAPQDKASLFETLTPRPDRQPITWEDADGQSWSGDLYLPAWKARAGLVLVPGIAKAGKDDPRLVALANSLSRARFLVLVPDLPSLRAQEISAQDRRPLASAARYLMDQRGLPGVGMAAISYGAAPAMLAALDEPRIAFVIGVGGVYDLGATATFFTTGAFRLDDRQPWQHQQPNAFGKWAFVLANVSRLDDSRDRVLLADLARRKMADPTVSDDVSSRLVSQQAKAVMALLNNEDPAQVLSLMTRLPPRMQAEISAMDLAGRDLSNLGATVFLFHGRDDRIIPWTQSAALAARTPHAHLVILDHLAHTDLSADSIRDAHALWRGVSDVLSLRDRLAPPIPVPADNTADATVQ